MKQKITALLLSGALALGMAPGALAAAPEEEAERETPPISVTVNGRALSFNSFSPELDAESGRTFLPLRQTFEALGCAPGDITWDSETQTARAVRWGTTVTLALGSTEAQVTSGGATRTEAMDAAPYMKTDENGGGYVYVPLRFAAQALGCAVNWDEATRTVAITDDFLTAENAAGVISFANLDERVRSGNITMQTLDEQIAALEVIDYDRMKDQLRDAMNGMAAIQWDSIANLGVLGSIAASSMSSAYSSLQKQMKDLKDGKVQRDAADAVRQLKNMQNLMVAGAESIYIVITDLEANYAAMQRKLETMDRTLRVMETQHALGRVSDLNLEQARSGRTALVSGMETLAMNISVMKLNLEQQTGGELTGKSILTPLPAVTADELSAMNLDADLAKAKEASFELHDALATLNKAKDDWKDAQKKYAPSNYNFQSAQHIYQAAQLTYENAFPDYERRFRVLFLQVKDYAQVLAAAEDTLKLEQQEYAAEQSKFALGNISSNALADARDEVLNAQDAVDTAARNLFSAYNNYRWAVDYGVLN